MDKIILETNFTEKVWPDDIPYKHILKQVGPHMYDYIRLDVNGVGWGTKTFHSLEEALQGFLKIVKENRKTDKLITKNLKIIMPEVRS